MKTLFLILSLLCFSSQTFASTPNTKIGSGEGGMAECISLSIEAAIADYEIDKEFNRVPDIVISKSNISPSNGMDIMITINKHVTYYVIATPNTGTNYNLYGCTSARISEKK